MSQVPLGEVLLRGGVVSLHEVGDDGGRVQLVRAARARAHQPLARLQRRPCLHPPAASVNHVPNYIAKTTL